MVIYMKIKPLIILFFVSSVFSIDLGVNNDIDIGATQNNELECTLPLITVVSFIDTIGDSGIYGHVFTANDFDSMAVISDGGDSCIRKSATSDSVYYWVKDTGSVLIQLRLYMCETFINIYDTIKGVTPSFSLDSIMVRGIKEDTIYYNDTMLWRGKKRNVIFDSIVVDGVKLLITDQTDTSTTTICSSGVSLGWYTPIWQADFGLIDSCDSFYVAGTYPTPVVDTIYNSVLRQADNWQVFRLYDTINIEGVNFGDSGSLSAIFINSTGTILADLVSWTATKVRGIIPYGTPRGYYRARVRRNNGILTANPTKNNMKVIIGSRS